MKLAYVLLAIFTITTSLANKKKPNVIIIYGDDVGFGDISFAGAKKIKTPNVDHLAENGLFFSNGHCTSSTCTPSRYGLLSGVYPWRKKNTGIAKGSAKMIINQNQFTLADVFKKAGYTTGVIGKWHLGLGDGNINWNGDVKPGPLELGFDESFLIPATGDRVPCVYLEGYNVVNLDKEDPIIVKYGNGDMPNAGNSTVYPAGEKNKEHATNQVSNSRNHWGSIIQGIPRIGRMAGGKKALWKDEDMADDLVNRTRKFINDHNDKPFFLFFSAHDIHVPRFPHKRFIGKSGCGLRGDAMVQFDWCVGEIREMLKKHNIEENTIIIFSSDNGPVIQDGYADNSKKDLNGHKAAGPFKGGKYSNWEGGTRVPFIVYWPKTIEAKKSDALVCQVDFIASFANMLGVEVPKDQAIDSKNILTALLGNSTTARKHLVTGRKPSSLSLHTKEWKLIKNNKTTQLFNLKNDIIEKKNVISKNKEKAQELLTILNKIIKK